MSEDRNTTVTLRAVGREVTTDSATIERLTREMSGMVEFAGEVKPVGVKPQKVDGTVVGVEMQIVFTAPLNGEALRALSDRAGKVVRVKVASFDRMLFDEETGEIKERV